MIDARFRKNELLVKKMKISPTTTAILVLPLVVWVTSALTSESIAGGHYRLGTLNESIHYRDNEDFNSSHDGIYLVHKRHVFGTYYNSESEQSLFYARNNPINRTWSYSYGVAFGYELGVMPMVGLSAQISIVKFTLTQQAAVVGLEFPLF